MAETWITRAQLAQLTTFVFGDVDTYLDLNRADRLKEHLAEIGIKVEEDTSVADDELAVTPNRPALLRVAGFRSGT